MNKENKTSDKHEHSNDFIANVSESISVTKNELQAFLEDWDNGKQNVYDAEWNELSKRLANFMGLLIP